MRLMAAVALAAATWIGPPAPSAAGEEPSTDSEVLVAYCVGVFGADAAGSNAFQAPVCLANERTDDCLVRIADIDRERQRVDGTLRRLQDSLAARGIVAPPRYMALAKYLVATSCWEGL
jgi:hypothetical protein